MIITIIMIIITMTIMNGTMSYNTPVYNGISNHNAEIFSYVRSLQGLGKDRKLTRTAIPRSHYHHMNEYVKMSYSYERT